MRAFIAIQPPEELLAAARALQGRLRRELPDNAVRWASHEQLHLTLKFLGDIPPDSLAELTRTLQEICRASIPFRLRACGLSRFPVSGPPRVIWVGLEGDLAQLQALQSAISLATEKWSEHHETRAFHPHLTIGRVGNSSPRSSRPIARALSGIPDPMLGSWQVEHVNLVQSELSPQGARHTTLATIPFRRLEIPELERDV